MAITQMITAQIARRAFNPVHFSQARDEDAQQQDYRQAPVITKTRLMLIS
jgi:hypothetical protein